MYVEKLNNAVSATGLRSRSRKDGVGDGFLTTLAIGVGFFCLAPGAQLDNFSHDNPKLGIPFEMVQFLLKLLLKQIFLAVNHDFH